MMHMINSDQIKILLEHVWQYTWLRPVIYMTHSKPGAALESHSEDHGQ